MGSSSTRTTREVGVGRSAVEFFRVTEPEFPTGWCCAVHVEPSLGHLSRRWTLWHGPCLSIESSPWASERLGAAPARLANSFAPEYRAHFPESASCRVARRGAEHK